MYSTIKLNMVTGSKYNSFEKVKKLKYFFNKCVWTRAGV